MNNSKGLVVLDYFELVVGFFSLLAFLFAYVLCFDNDIKILFIFLDIFGFLIFMDGLDGIVSIKRNEL